MSGPVGLELSTLSYFPTIGLELIREFNRGYVCVYVLLIFLTTSKFHFCRLAVAGEVIMSEKSFPAKKRRQRVGDIHLFSLCKKLPIQHRLFTM